MTRGRALRMVAGVGALAVPATAATAQRVTTSVDLSGASMRYADSLNATATVLGPALTIRWPRVSVAASGTVSGMSGGAWTSQGLASASWFTPAAGVFSAEFAGSVGGSAHRDGTHTAQTLANARGYASTAHGGVWAGVGTGSMSDGIAVRGVTLAEVGGWLQGSVHTVLVSASPVTVDDSIRYTDVQLGWRARTSSWELGASIGSRAGAHLPTLGGAATTWASGTLVHWFSPTVGIVAAGGTYPVDLTQGFPGGRFLTLGLRLRWASRTDPAGAGAVAPVGAIEAFEVTGGEGRRRTIRVRAGAASRVEVSGDVTGWQPVSCVRRRDGWWSVDIDADPGVHQVTVRVDGGAWLVPPGLTPLTDEFGGVVGLMLIR